METIPGTSHIESILIDHRMECAVFLLLLLSYHLILIPLFPQFFPLLPVFFIEFFPSFPGVWLWFIKRRGTTSLGSEFPFEVKILLPKWFLLVKLEVVLHFYLFKWLRNFVLTLITLLILVFMVLEKGNLL